MFPTEHASLILVQNMLWGKTIGTTKGWNWMT